MRKSRNGEKANTYERKSEKTEGWRAGEQKKKAERGESEGVTFKYLNKMENQDPREHHCARQLKTEFKVCRI